MSKKAKVDHPFDAVVANAIQKIKDGFTVFQKFTCVKCGNRLTMDVPNKFFTHGTCDKCGATTDIKLMGHNFVAMFTSGGPSPEELVRAATKKKES